MSYATVGREPSKFDSLLDNKLQKIEELIRQLRNEPFMEDEMELLKRLSQEMREVLYLRENYFRDSENNNRN